jgi:histidine ammonia-lyase
VVRALLVVRVNQLLAGGAGIHPSVAEGMLTVLAGDATPVVHELGGIGTGDLTAMAEVGLCLAGEGAWQDGHGPAEPPAEPVEFATGDGLALMSSNACTLGRAALASADVRRIVSSADAVAGLSMLACSGSASSFDPRVFEAHRARGPMLSASRVRDIIGDGPGAAARLQDPYGLRCAPQLNGAALDSLDRLISVIETDLNSASENPLIVRGGGTGGEPGAAGGDVALSNGNFLANELSGALDHLRNALAGVGLGSLARLGLLCDPSMTGATRYLTDGTPGASGVMILEYTAQAAMDRLRLAATATSCWPVAISAGVENLASHAPVGVEQLEASLEALSLVIGAELVAAVRAIGLRSTVPATPAGRALLERARAALSDDVTDRPLGPDVTAAASLVVAGVVAA